MKKRIITGIISMVMLSNVGVYAEEEEYWAKANSNIETGIGAEEDGEIKPGNIEHFIKNGWTSAIAGPKNQEEVYVSPYENEIDLVARLGLMSEISVNDKKGFYPQEKLTYYDYVETLKKLTKYSSLDTTKLQNVENIVTCERVLTDLVTILGYDYFIKVGETNYISLADEYGVTNGISLQNKDAITREQFAKVISNILEIDMLTVKIGDTVTYEVEEGNNLLSQMKVEEIKGWVNANENSNMYNPYPATKGKIQIDAVEYFAGTSGAEDYLGRYVTAYVQEDDNEEKTVIKIDAHKNDNFLEVLSDDIEKITKENMEYYPLNSEGRQMTKKTVKFELDGNVLYNGRIMGTVESVDEGILKPKNGIVNLSDTDFDNSYDIVFVWDFENYVADIISGTRVVMKNNKGLLDFDPEKRDIIFYMDGVLSNVKELTDWNVLSVAKSKDDSLWTVYASSKSIFGTYKSKNEDKFILGDGSEIPVDESFFGSVKFGEEYKFYLSHFGKIVTCSDASKDTATKTGTGRNYAYLKKCYLNEEDEDAASFRIFRLSNSSWVTLKGAEKMNFYDGSAGTGKDGNVERKRLTAAEVAEKLEKPQLIVYETDVYNNISAIYTAVDYTENGKVNNDVFAHNMYRKDEVRTYYGGYFGGIYQQGKYILVRVPENREQEEYYAVDSTSSDGYLTGPMDIYDVNEDMILSGVILRYTSANNEVTNRNDMHIIDKIESVEHGDDIVFKITTIQNKELYLRNEEGIGLEAVVKDADGKAMWHVKNAGDLKKGDMMCASVDDLNYITGFRVDARISELQSKAYFSYRTGDSPALLSHDYGVVIRNAEGSHVILNASGDTSDSTQNKIVVVSGTICSYDTRTGKFENISKADILPGDVILSTARYYYMNAQTIVIK